MVTRQLQVERRTGKVRRSTTNVLPLYHATNLVLIIIIIIIIIITIIIIDMFNVA